jgi:anti-anti-sigma factor
VSPFTVSRRAGTVVVTIHGEMGVDDCSAMEGVLRDLIDAQGNLDVVLDLGDVVHLQHDAMTLIVQAAHQAHSHGGRLRLADRACLPRWRSAATPQET